MPKIFEIFYIDQNHLLDNPNVIIFQDLGIPLEFIHDHDLRFAPLVQGTPISRLALQKP